MWIFDGAVSNIRKYYDLVVKIEAHSSSVISGKGEGRVLAEVDPLRHPIRKSVPPSVPVKFIDRKRRGTPVIESLPVASLRPNLQLKDKGLHLIVKGERTGTLVTHIKTEGQRARVHEVNKPRHRAFWVEKRALCVLELNV